MRILVIEDDPEVREMVYKMLKKEGYEVVEAGNGKEAFELLSIDPKIDLVITDIIMPEKEGIETIIELKRDYPHIKILAISGGGKGSAQNYLAIAKKFGADLTLSKPFVKQELLEAVQEILERK